MTGCVIVNQVLTAFNSTPSSYAIHILNMFIKIKNFNISGYIYYPEKSQCYGAYRRGPCKLNEYLILPKNDVIPKCVASPCDNENFVHFGGKCHELDKPGPCPVPELENVVGVNETTLEIICTKGFSDFLKDRFLGDTSKEQIAATIFTTTTTKRPNYVDPNFYIENKCFKGGMRWIDNQCPKQNEDQNNDSQLTK